MPVVVVGWAALPTDSKMPGVGTGCPPYGSASGGLQGYFIDKHWHR